MTFGQFKHWEELSYEAARCADSGDAFCRWACDAHQTKPCAIACLLSAQAVAQPPKAASRELNAILSMTEDQAIAIATSMAAGTTEPIAINDVNRVARAEVCRH